MSFSYSFRDKPRLSERIRGKSGDELFKELRKELDQDRKLFFDNPASNWGSSTGSTFSRAGHLFDDPLTRGHTDVRSHLEDLAQRHPEFADQLRYPAWSNNNSSSTLGGKQRGSGQTDPREPSTQQQAAPQPESSEEYLRGRSKENLRNTVPDMGQKQQQEKEEKESRGQRSWSAPPDNRSQQSEKPRFVSKIEIHPVNPDSSQVQQTGDATKPPMAPPKPQPQPQQQPQQPLQSQPKHSTVRHIPIFVEGRDEPILPKNIEPEFVQTQAPPQQQFSRPSPQSHYTSSHQHFHSQPPTKKQQTPPLYEQSQVPSRFEQQSVPTEFSHPQSEQQQPQPPSGNPKDPLFRVECVQKDIDELKTRVDNFSGNSRSDKEYIILDELLTRNLIKLDDIETEGKEEVRTARKNTIKSIQRCISVLENKVPMPSCENNGNEAMDVKQEHDTVSVNHQEEATSEQLSVENKVQEQTSKEMNSPGASEASSAEKKLETSDEDNKAVNSDKVSDEKAA